jgi:hypothetical protein
MTAMIANYSLQVVQKKQDMTNFYDIGNPEVGDLALRAVTGGSTEQRYTRQLSREFRCHCSYRQRRVLQTNRRGARTEFLLPTTSGVHSSSRDPFPCVCRAIRRRRIWNTYFTAQGLWRPSDSVPAVAVVSLSFSQERFGEAANAAGQFILINNPTSFAVTFLVARLIRFLVLVFFEVSLLAVVPVLRVIILAFAHPLLVSFVFRVLLLVTLVMFL